MESFKVSSLVEHKIKLIGSNGQPAASISSP